MSRQRSPSSPAGTSWRGNCRDPIGLRRSGAVGGGELCRARRRVVRRSQRGTDRRRARCRRGPPRNDRAPSGAVGAAARSETPDRRLARCVPSTPPGRASRPDTPSFRYAPVRCISTVRRVRNSASAISRLLQPLGGHRRDPALLRRERVDTAERWAARACPGRLAARRSPDRSRRPTRNGSPVEPFAQRLASVAAMAAATQRGAQVGQRPGMRYAQLGAGEDVHRAAGQLRHLAARSEQGLHAQRFSDRLRRAEPRRDRELFLDQLAGPVAVAEAGRRERRVAPPHQRHRVHVCDGQRAPAGLLEIGQGGAGSPIRRASRPREASAWLC